MPVLLAVGQREVEEETVAMRRLGSKRQKVMKLDEAANLLSDEIENRSAAATRTERQRVSEAAMFESSFKRAFDSVASC